MTNRPTNDFDNYHAHVYFDAATLDHARLICDEAGERFGVVVGTVHERTIGPHPRWSCQLSFERTQFQGLIAWLDEARGDLSVLVHALTGNDLADHSTHASWLGEPVELKMSVFETKDDA